MGFNDQYGNGNQYQGGGGHGGYPGSQQPQGSSSTMPLQMLQHQVEKQPQMLNVNGSSPINAGPGFDPFQRDEPSKRDEISYDWVCFFREIYILLLLFSRYPGNYPQH